MQACSIKGRMRAHDTSLEDKRNGVGLGYIARSKLQSIISYILIHPLNLFIKQQAHQHLTLMVINMGRYCPSSASSLGRRRTAIYQNKIYSNKPLA